MPKIFSMLKKFMHKNAKTFGWVVVPTVVTLAGSLRAVEQAQLDVPIATYEGVANPLPVYPEESLKLKESGKVLLRVQVDQFGNAGPAIVETSSSHQRLDEAVLETVKTWKFKPKRIAGVAVDDWVLVPVSFSANKVVVETLLTSNSKYWTVDQNGCRLFDYNVQAETRFRWTGTCVEGYIDGEGRLTALKNGLEVHTMTGTYKRGLIEGYATRVITHQSEYNGNFVRGLKHGKGVQIWKHGMRYEGSFEYNDRTGHAVVSWPNGVRYEGRFVNGEPVDKVMQPPKLSSRNKLRYPQEFEGVYIQGEVSVGIWMTDKGGIKEVEVLQSDHPALEKEALKALVASEFLPATINGKPIPSISRQPINFGLKGIGFKPYEVKLDETGDIPKAQLNQLRPDRLPTFKVIAPLVYPYDLMRKNVTGDASAVVTIDPAGQPSEIKITSASQPEFADAMRAMLASSTFNPALKDGVAIWSKMTLSRTFSRGSGDAFFDKHVLRLLAKIKDNQRDICKLADLDGKPNAIFHPLPIAPDDYSLTQDESVMLSFYIDKTGRVQLPQVLKTNHPALGWLAMTAVSRWQFVPPTVKGEPVDVTVNLPIVFSAPTAL